MIPVVTGLHPKLIDAVQQTIAEAKARKLNVAIHSGLRGEEEQNKLYALGRTVKNPDGITKEKPMGRIITFARGWESWHNYGLAVDIVFKDSKGGWTWGVPTDTWKQLGACGEIFGLEWGGRFASPDYPHFQIKGNLHSIPHAKKILFEQGVDAVWALV